MSSSSSTPMLPGGTTAPMSTAPLAIAPMTSAGVPMLSEQVTTACFPTPPAPVTSAPPPAAVFTPEQMTSTLQQLVTAVQGLDMNQYQQYMAGAYDLPPAAPIATYGHPAPWLFPGAPACGGPSLLPFQTGTSSGPPPAAAGLWHLPPPPSTAPLWHLQPLPSPAVAAPVQPALLPLQPSAPPLHSSGAPSLTGLPIHQVRFPPSPSPLPAWAAGSSPSPVYTTAPEQPTPFPQFGGPSGSAGPYPEYSDQAPPASLLRTCEPARHGALTQTPSRFAKIDFATYDGTEDPLNWLNQCDQFFRGQRTLASERTWLASYHLRGAAHTWYYALKQDKGAMPPWERFRELCLLRFGPPVRGSRLAELGRLPFTSTVQDFADRFQALACHASGVTAQQRADLFFGGLPDHIRVDVELRGPQDLQTAMYYARAVAIQQESPSRAAGSLPSPDSAQGRPAQASAAPLAVTAARPFRRLTSAELLERRRQGLCFDCDEPYTPGHACPRLFYLEVADYIPEDAVAADLAAPAIEQVFDAG
ncbi:uncharacterized protein [Triticum aestivum]|uniref:uncharacterized protein isoform X1 n=1 Tax=Triticum aestivum TaxID=4565 RepID=UPI001D0350BF|nr:uncharacterized protein LOC123182498 isoform X1 [Triticum aestivum]XP_044451015.1 uncharacterized protein LOC123182498 isoform X1 [Triticum aestivum]XP_044451016.1 uncharacterized protein LOC123182498 isoform X1 [Triticum aestivum]XP_044451017.1 uncharacterized protein LOC123182498 isoform X1 [Triticum aestivum]XP_044451018.1 uncharacterized protein LOC123182498 isoform X1 [Triticum aestivum]XP_044451019.1 uncharacterized protein LOC123182498 isoform X1 [Triticum aestivum]